jgi:hypothetical protein
MLSKYAPGADVAIIHWGGEGQLSGRVRRVGANNLLALLCTRTLNVLAGYLVEADQRTSDLGD